MQKLHSLWYMWTSNLSSSIMTNTYGSMHGVLSNDQIWALCSPSLENSGKKLMYWLEWMQKCDKFMSKIWMCNVDHIRIYTFHCLVLTQVEMMDSMRQKDVLSQMCLNHSKLWPIPIILHAPFHTNPYRRLYRFQKRPLLNYHVTKGEQTAIC